MATGTALEFNTTEFTDLFPEFVDVDPLVLEAQMRRTCFSTNEYKGILSNCGQDSQYYALYLNMAHNLALADRFSGDCDKTPVVKEKSKNDEVTYAVDTKVVGGTGLDTTRYGVELQDIITACSSLTGYMSCGTNTVANPRYLHRSF